MENRERYRTEVGEDNNMHKGKKQFILVNAS